MDTRNGNLYRSEEAAREAGVPSGNILGPLSVDGEITWSRVIYKSHG